MRGEYKCEKLNGLRWQFLFHFYALPLVLCTAASKARLQWSRVHTAANTTTIAGTVELRMNIIDLPTSKNTVIVHQDYSELIANYRIKVLPMPNQVQASHDFISVTVLHRDHESEGAATRHAIDEVVRKIKLKRQGKSWN